MTMFGRKREICVTGRADCPSSVFVVVTLAPSDTDCFTRGLFHTWRKSETLTPHCANRPKLAESHHFCVTPITSDDHPAVRVQLSKWTRDLCVFNLFNFTSIWGVTGHWWKNDSSKLLWIHFFLSPLKLSHPYVLNVLIHGAYISTNSFTKLKVRTSKNDYIISSTIF